MNNLKDDEGEDVNEKQTKMKARPSLITNTPKKQWNNMLDAWIGIGLIKIHSNFFIYETHCG